MCALPPKPLAALSETGREEHTELMMFLRDRLYRTTRWCA